MINIAVVDTNGKQKENIDLKQEIFGLKVKKSVLFDIVKMQLNNKRQGNASTKNRAEVNKTGKKPWKQKGTGRARAGSAGSPVWRGGGVVFGPRPHSYSYEMPKKTSKLALKMALSEKILSNQLMVLSGLNIAKPKTKDMFDILKKLKIENNKILLVLNEKNDSIIKSARNIPNVHTITTTGLNVYDLLNSDKILMTIDAINKIQEVLN